MFVVAATGHHWWLDGFVALALLGVGLWGDTRWRRSRAAAALAAVTPAAAPAPLPGS